jgi:hypothetical protein
LVYRYKFQHLLCDDLGMYHREILLLMYLLTFLYIDQYGIRWNVYVDHVITYWHHSSITPSTSLHKVMFSILFGILFYGQCSNCKLGNDQIKCWNYLDFLWTIHHNLTIYWMWLCWCGSDINKRNWWQGLKAINILLKYKQLSIIPCIKVL